MWIFSRLFGNKRADKDAADETEAPKQAGDAIERAAQPLKIADLPEESDAYLRDTKWPPDPRFNRSFTVLQVFNQQGGLIRRICSAMPLSDEDLERYFLPAVWNVANFVHLLSASQDTHHRGYGGLFAHSRCLSQPRPLDPRMRIGGSRSRRREGRHRHHRSNQTGGGLESERGALGLVA